MSNSTADGTFPFKKTEFGLRRAMTSSGGSGATKEVGSGEEAAPLFVAHEDEDAAPAVRRRSLYSTVFQAVVFVSLVASIGVARRAQLAWRSGAETLDAASVSQPGSAFDAPAPAPAPEAPDLEDDGADAATDAAEGASGADDDEDDACDATVWAGEPYQYMYGSKWDGARSVSRTASLKTWEAAYGSVYTACNVSVSRLDLDASDGPASTPSADADAWFSLDSDAYVVVGNVSVELAALTAAGSRSYRCASDAAAGGCMYWVGAGTRLRASANASATLAFLTVGGATLSNATDSRSSDGAALFVDDVSCGPLYAAGGECADGGMAVNGECEGGLFDNLDNDISPPFPRHYHPRGAFYYVVAGSMTFNDTGREGEYIEAGDMRFVNAHVYYGPEAGNASTVFLSLHEPDPAAFGSWYRAGAVESGSSACDFVCTSEPGDDPLTCTQGW